MDTSDHDDVDYKAVGLLVMAIFFGVIAAAGWFYLGPPSWCDHSTWMC